MNGSLDNEEFDRIPRIEVQTVAKMIVFLTNIPTPYRTSFFDELAHQCEMRGVSHHVLYCATTEPNRNWPFEPEAMKHRFEVLPGWHPAFSSFYPHFNPTIVSRLRRLKPSVLLCGGAWNTPTVLLAASKALWNGRCVLLWSEGHEEAALNSSGIVPAIRRWAYRRFDGFAVPNARSGHWARRNSGWDAPLLSLPNTVDEAFYTRTSAVERLQARTMLNIDPDSRVLLQVSQLEPRKGVIELATAFRAVTKSTNAKLVIVGGGSLGDRIRRDFADEIETGRIILPGQVDRFGVRRWLMAADVFVLNTLRDPNPLSPIEAAFAQLPLVVSKLAGNTGDLVVEGETGIAIENPRVPDRELSRVLSMDCNRLERMGIAAQKVARQSFSLRMVVDRFLNEVAALSSSVDS